MPLKKGKSASTRSKNIKEMIHKYKESGKIGHTEPGSMKKALKIAAAAAYRKSRESK